MIYQCKGILLIVTLLSSLAQAQTQKTYLPENSIRIPTFVEGSGVSKQEFYVTLSNFEKLYKPVVKEKGFELKVIGDWDSDTVNAYTNREGNTIFIRIFGGLARHHYMSPDALSIVACHEMGHNIGGAPTYKDRDNMSNEGQSDYWATLKCSRKLFREFKTLSVLDDQDEVIAQACEKSHNKGDDYDICKRAMEASKRLSFMLAELMHVALPNVSTPDETVVKKTNNSHPAAQCRLDTYFQGALCRVDYRDDVSQTDPRVGTCNDNEIGGRPACWYKN